MAPELHLSETLCLTSFFFFFLEFEDREKRLSLLFIKGLLPLLLFHPQEVSIGRIHFQYRNWVDTCSVPKDLEPSRLSVKWWRVTGEEAPSGKGIDSDTCPSRGMREESAHAH